MTWQPIDTVPLLEDVLLSDGMHITVGKTIAGPHCAYWIAVVDGENATKGKAMVPWVLQWKPTHWRPLPSKPDKTTRVPPLRVVR